MLRPGMVAAGTVAAALAYEFCMGRVLFGALACYCHLNPGLVPGFWGQSWWVSGVWPYRLDPLPWLQDCLPVELGVWIVRYLEVRSWG